MSGAQEAAPAGLKPIPLVAESYQLASIPAEARQLLNLYPEKLPDGGRAGFYLKSTPGLEGWRAVGSGPILATATLAGAIWIVSGDHAFVAPDNLGAAIDLGNVGTALGFGSADPVNGTVTITVGLAGVVICVPPNAWVVDFDTVTPAFNPIGGTFPAGGASSVCYLNGYYIFTSFNGTQFFWSQLLAPTNFNPLDFAAVSSQVDYVEEAVSHNGELWLFGQNAVRVWYLTGDANAPFQPRVGGVIPHGYGARRTIQSLDGSLWWLGIDNLVYRTQGYKAVRVSSFALEQILANYNGGFLRDASACAYMHDGHAFYALSLPSAEVGGRTFVYDVATEKWHERNSKADGTGRWNINTASLLGARTVLGSSVDGELWHQRSNLLTEGGVKVPRTAALPALVTHGPRAFMSRVEIEMEVGTPTSSPGVALHWSDDGGINFTTPRSLASGGLGATRSRIATTRLGSFRNRVLRIISTDACTIYGVDADIQGGMW